MQDKLGFFSGLGLWNFAPDVKLQQEVIDYQRLLPEYTNKLSIFLANADADWVITITVQSYQVRFYH